MVSDFLRPRAMIKLALRPQSILWSGLDTLSLRYEAGYSKTEMQSSLI